MSGVSWYVTAAFELGTANGRLLNFANTRKRGNSGIFNLGNFGNLGNLGNRPWL